MNERLRGQLIAQIDKFLEVNAINQDDHTVSVGWEVSKNRAPYLDMDIRVVNRNSDHLGWEEFGKGDN